MFDKQDITERWLNAKTIGGIYLVVGGVLMLIDMRFWSTLLPLSFVVLGARMIQVNDIKFQLKQLELMKKHKE